MPRLVVLTGPIAAGKNATAEALLRRASGRGLTVVLVDLDDVAAMVGSPGAAAAGLWFAAHQSCRSGNFSGSDRTGLLTLRSNRSCPLR